MARVFLDKFSGEIVDLPKNQRTELNMLIALKKCPRVSTWDMEQIWLVDALSSLIEEGYIEDISSTVQYPWHKYKLTQKGQDYVNG